MDKPEREGVIKFSLDYTPTDTDLIEAFNHFSTLNQCRGALWRLGVLGQDDSRYGGLGYGNVSLRVASPDFPNAFLITGTQTGHLPRLSAQHYALATGFDLQRHSLRAQGPCKPSSEAMTHASLYHKLPHIQAVIHGHSPAIWQNTQRLGLAYTSTNVPYGTPEMAQAMQDLLDTGEPPRNTIVMLGHEDGFITWGDDMDNALKQVSNMLTTLSPTHQEP